MPEKLSKSTSRIIMSTENEVSVSVVTFWEISLKYAIGKLELSGVEPDQLPDFAEQTDINVLSINPYEASSFHRLPKLKHKDPFDRLIVWQAIQRKMTLISKDRAFREYGKFGLRTYW